MRDPVRGTGEDPHGLRAEPGGRPHRQARARSARVRRLGRAVLGVGGGDRARSRRDRRSDQAPAPRRSTPTSVRNSCDPRSRRAFADRAAIVSGGSTGIGRAVTQQLMREGADVCVVAAPGSEPTLEAVAGRGGGRRRARRHDRGRRGRSRDRRAGRAPDARGFRPAGPPGIQRRPRLLRAGADRTARALRPHHARQRPGHVPDDPCRGSSHGRARRRLRSSAPHRPPRSRGRNTRSPTTCRRAP